MRRIAILVLVTLTAACGSSAPSTRQAGRPEPPAGVATRPVGFRGVTVQVPVAWKLDDSWCGTPRSDTVLFEDVPVNTCKVSEPAGLTVVRLGPATSMALAPSAFRRITIDGHPARRGAGVVEGHPVTVVVVDDRNAAASFQAPDKATRERLADTLTVVDVDPLGCPVHDGLGPRHPTGPTDRLVGVGATAVVICRYSDDLLSRSAAVPAARVEELVAVLDALPEGVSHPGAGFGELPEACAQESHRGFVLRIALASGGEEEVVVHISGCTDLFASNGARTTHIDEPLVTFLTHAVGYDSGFPNPSELR